MNTSISRRQFLKASGLAAAGACAAGLLTGCGGSSSGSASGAASSGSGSSYTILYDSQPATLNYLTTGTDLEMVVGANCVDTLVEYDNKGVMREGLATSWDWDVDTLTWTFHLREENWVDCNGEVVAPVTAQDFVDALKYVLTPDYAASNVGLVTAYIAGADDYYNYHVYLNNANTGVVDDDGTTYTVDGSGVVTVTAPDSDPATYAPVDFDAVGVTAVDDHTLTYTLTYDFPGFLSLLCYLPYEPAYGPLLEETGDQFATSAETTYSCGAFYLAAYESLETWVMKKNPENYDADNVFIDTIIVCSMTGFAILVTGVWNMGADHAGLLTHLAFEKVFPNIGGIVVTCALSIFAFTTVLGWAVYGERCVIYLFGDHAVKYFRIVFCLVAAAGCVMALNTVWLISDTANALMAFPNLIGILLLSPKIVQIIREEVQKDPSFKF